MFEFLYDAFTFLFSPILVFSPLVSVFFISVFLTLLVIGINKLVVNRKLVKEIKDRMEGIREQLTTAQKANNKEDTDKFFAEMMKANNEYMKHTFKALIVSLVIISIFLPWVRYKFEGMTIATMPFEVPMIGSTLGWLYWYILVSFAIGWVMNKMLE
jgi:uncharacterized membrane protein (DUF106 family)